MNVAWQACALVAAALHVVFFLLESVLFTRPAVQARFLIDDPAVAERMRVVMLNQGFYNLFLALGVVGGLLLARRHAAVGRSVALYACLCMLGAGVVLAGSEPRLLLAAAVQLTPPALALTLFAVARRQRAGEGP